MKVAIVALFSLLFTVLQAKGNEFITEKVSVSKESKQNALLLENFQNLDKEIKNLTNTGLKLLLPILMETMQKVNLSQECKKNSMYLLSGIKRTKMWALQFIDSSGKLPDGLLVGSYSAFGAYDECLDIQVKKTRYQKDEELLFQGQYCLVELKFEGPPKPKANYMLIIPDELKNLTQGDTVINEFARGVNFLYEVILRIGLCTPSGCSTEDVNNMVQFLSKGRASVSRCEKKEQNKFTPFIIFVISYCSFLSFLVFLATLISIYSHYTAITFKSSALQVLMSFSLYSNFKIFSSSKKKSGNLNCLNGVRFFGMSWIVMGHTSIFSTLPLTHGLKKVLTHLPDFAIQVNNNATLAVDTFFVIGGLLVSYLTIKLCKQQNQKFNAWMFIIYRVLRTLPTYSLILMFISIIPLLGSGPVWDEIFQLDLGDCKDNWWTNILFINNLYKSENMCYTPTWYLAADFQLYILSLLIIIPFLKKPKVGFLLAILAIMTCIVCSGIITYIKDIPPTFMMLHLGKRESRDYIGNFYGLPVVHLGPYAVGLLLGYFLAVKPDLKMPLLTQIIGWSLAITFCMTTLYGTGGWYKHVKPFALTVAYASFCRTAFSLGIAWMIMCCATGHGGIINYILSWRVFAPLSRLTFAVYLVHLLVITVFFGCIKTRLQPDYFLFVWFYVGNLCASYAIAFVVHMLVEVPFANVVRYFLSKPGKKMDESSDKKDNIIDEELKKEIKNNIIVLNTTVNENSKEI